MMKTTKNSGTNFAQRLTMIVCTALVIGAILVGAAWGLYRLALANTSHAGAVGWALAVTALLPVGGYVCYRLGKTESRGVMDGIAAGVGAVAKTANDIAGIKVTATRNLRAPAPVYPAALPKQVVVEMTGDSGEIIYM